MQINNNSQSPNFGMSLRVSKEGLPKYVAGSAERAKGLLELGERVTKADKEHEANIIALLKKNNVSASEHPYEDFVREYTPNIYLDKNGDLYTDAFQMRDRSSIYVKDDLKNAVMSANPDLSNPEEIKRVLDGLNNSRSNALQFLSEKIKEIVGSSNLDKLMKDIVSRFGF